MLFDSYAIRSLNFRNRICVSPMCQYSSHDGFANDWHFIHLGSRAVGGAALVFTEACAVTPEGRISPQDLGIWKDEHTDSLARITRFIKSHNAFAGIQLAHAGRKASTAVPWLGGQKVMDEQGGWTPVAPSPLAFADYRQPKELSLAEMQVIKSAFVAAARRALSAGFEVIELHAAHGYLFHEFLSPISNQRTDDYGGSFANRTRFVLECVREIRHVWPADLPLFVRISATDWLEQGGWDLEQSIELASLLKKEGVDLLDCSSGGIAPKIRIPVQPGYQVPFAQAIREKAGVATGAVGLITEPAQAEEILKKGQADLVFLARELLRDPYWPLRAAHELGVNLKWPEQYERAKQK